RASRLAAAPTVSLPRLTRFRVRTGVGTPRASLTSTARMTRGAMRVPAVTPRVWLGRAGFEPATLGLKVAPGRLTSAHAVTESALQRRLSSVSGATESHVVSGGRVAPKWPHYGLSAVPRTG